MDGIDRVLSDFIIESQENLERLDHEFIELEHDPNNGELLASIFRTIHTIKGSAGFLNLTNLEQVSHYAEDILAKLREHSLILSDDIVTTLLRAVDCIKSMLLILEKTGEEGEVDVLDVIVELKKIADNKTFPQSERAQDIGAAFIAIEPDSQTSTKPTGSEPQKPLKPGARKTIKNTKSSENLEFAPGAVEDTRIHVDIRLLDQLMNLDW